MDNLIVLFVDDEIAFLETLMKRMNRRGVKAMGAASGEEGLKHLGQNPVDVVVLDVKMPGLDGIQTLQEIKKIKPLVEVIMLTGHASLETASVGMAMGAFDYLMKPIDIDELLYKVQDAYKFKQIREDKIKSIERVIRESE